MWSRRPRVRVPSRTPRSLDDPLQRFRGDEPERSLAFSHELVTLIERDVSVAPDDSETRARSRGSSCVQGTERDEREISAYLPDERLSQPTQ